MKGILKEDILSGKKDVWYGKAGEHVEILPSDHGHVLIVQNKKGDRFPVNQDKVIKI